MTAPFDNQRWPEPSDPRRPERPADRAPFEQRYWYIWPVAGFIAGAMLVMALNPPGGTLLASVVAPTKTPTPTASTSTWTSPSRSTYRAPRRTYTFKPAPTYTPAPTTLTPKGTFGPGTHLVGTDIEAGTYRATVPADQSLCYWKRMSDTSGSMKSIIASDLANEGQLVVTVASTDAAFHSERCGAWTKV